MPLRCPGLLLGIFHVQGLQYNVVFQTVSASPLSSYQSLPIINYEFLW